MKARERRKVRGRGVEGGRQEGGTEREALSEVAAQMQQRPIAEVCVCMAWEGKE